MFFLTLECMPSSTSVRLLVERTEIELISFLEESPGGLRSDSKGNELSCSYFSCYLGYLVTIEGIWTGVGCRLSWSWLDNTWYFLLVVDCICVSKKTSSLSSSFPSATRSANFFLYSSHLLLKNMFVWISWCLSLSNCFFLSNILFLISYSLVVLLSSFSSFWASISYRLYWSSKACSLLWKWECNLTFSSWIVSSRAALVSWMCSVGVFYFEGESYFEL